MEHVENPLSFSNEFYRNRVEKMMKIVFESTKTEFVWNEFEKEMRFVEKIYNKV